MRVGGTSSSKFSILPLTRINTGHSFSASHYPTTNSPAVTQEIVVITETDGQAVAIKLSHAITDGSQIVDTES